MLHLVSQNHYLARVFAKHADQNVYGCAFPSPIDAQKCEKLAFLYLEANAIDGLRRSIAFMKVLDLNDVFHREIINKPQYNRKLNEISE